MRRIKREGKIDASVEKKKRNEILQSINAAKKEKETVDKNRKDIEVGIVTLTQIHEAKKSEVSVIGRQIDTLETKKAELESEIRPLESELDTLKQKISKEKYNLSELEKKVSEKGASITKELQLLDDTYHNRIEFTKKTVKSLNDQIAEKEARIAVLTHSEEQIASTLVSKEHEKKSLDVSLAHRMKELAQINKDLARTEEETENAEREMKKLTQNVDSKKRELEQFDKEIAAQTEKVQKAEKDAEEKRKQIVALVKREERLNELIPAVRGLYEKAGIKIDI